MSGSIFSYMGLMTKDDKEALNQQLIYILNQILVQKDLANTNKAFIEERLGNVLQSTIKNQEAIQAGSSDVCNELKDVTTRITKLENIALNISIALERIERKFDLFQQTVSDSHKLLMEMNEMINQDKQDTMTAVLGIQHENGEIKKELQNIGNGIPNNEDINIITSFLRLIAANQMLHEVNSTEV